MKSNAIEIRGVEKWFPGFKLGPVNLTVPEGAIYGFIGPNGSGKTTTLDLIFGLGAKQNGTIRVLGLDHAQEAVSMKLQAAYVTADFSLQVWGKVGRAIRFFSGFYPTWDEAYCTRLMSSFGLGWNDKIAGLSFGAKTKLNLLLALSWHPRVLLLDEPTTGLDAISKQQVFAELLEIVQSENRTVLIASHNLADVERFADHIGMIKHGQMLLEGPTAEIVERFRMADFTCPESSQLEREPSLRVRRHGQNRFRALLDMRQDALGRLQALGAAQITTAPVSLEEIFIALAQE